MKQNEVVERLSVLLGLCRYSNLYANKEPTKSTIESNIEALTEAIRAVELLPELVEALEHIKNANVFFEGTKTSRRIEELLKKAKGLSE